jgi:uncharacterized membrane protein YhiD involved in acid resistance
MPEAFRRALLEGPAPDPLTVMVRLIAAMALGGLVALVYRRTRPAVAIAPSFTPTLVLLAILIAMVTQVIGDNVARAFSLVGALSIVRFRTVVRDTQDTAYVIFAVGVGMAAGGGQYFVAIAGIAVGALAAVAMRRDAGAAAATPSFELSVRVGIGHDPRVLLRPLLDQHVLQCQLLSITTARQGLAVEAVYRIALRHDDAADVLVKALNGVEGVQAVSLRRAAGDDDNGSWRAP